MKHLLTIAVAVVLTAPIAAQSAADDSLSLFWLDDGTSGLDLADDPLVVRQGLLQAEVGALRRLAPPGEYPFEPITSVRFRLFGDPDWIKISIDARTETERGLRLSGSLQDAEYGGLVLVVHREGVVAGSVRTADDVFDIETLRTGEIVVTQLNATQFGLDEPQPPVDASPDGGQTSDFPDDPSTDAGVDGSSITILVAYSTDAMVQRGGQDQIETYIERLIGQANTAFRQSSVDAELSVISTIAIVYSKTDDDPHTDSRRLLDPADGYLDDLHQLRNTQSADLVHLIVDGHWTVEINGQPENVCGVAPTYDLGGADEAFAISGAGRVCSDLTFVHEIGHLMGLTHDPAAVRANNGRPQGAYSYSHGYVSGAGHWRTVMGYANRGCRAPCPRLAFFSDRIRTYDGLPRGDSQSDAVRSLNETRGIVANFR